MTDLGEVRTMDRADRTEHARTGAPTPVLRWAHVLALALVLAAGPAMAQDYRGLSTIMKYGQPGPEGSLTKWLWSETNQMMTQLAVDIVGPEALNAGNPWAYELLRARGNSIEGGTTEILKNIIAERVLGLPRK